MSLEFLITSLIVVVLPGTGVLYTLAIGLSQGFRGSIAAAFGCTLGIVPAALASIVGLSALLHTSALAFVILKYLGVLYLLYMAWNILREGGALQVKEEQSRQAYGKLVVTGFLLNVLNPKLSLLFLSFLPQFVDTAAVNVTQQLLGLAAVFMIMTFMVFVLYGLFAASTREFVLNRPSVMQGIKIAFSGAFGFLAVRLAFADK